MYIMYVLPYPAAGPSVQPLTDMLQGYGGDRPLELRCCDVTGVQVPEVQWYGAGVLYMEYILPDNGSLLIAAELGEEYLCLCL